MNRPKVLAVAALLATALTIPLAANAAVAPDSGYGTGGSASLDVECAANGYRGDFAQPAYEGRFYDLQVCGAGYVRLIALGADGEIDSDYGVDGRLTLRPPSACRNWGTTLVPAPDGSLYLVFAGVTTNGVPGSFDLHLCTTRITAAGKQVPTFGGATAYRRLERVGKEDHGISGATVDRAGRLVVFTSSGGFNGQHSWAYINRYTVSGKPDLTFGLNGQQEYTERGQKWVGWGGVVENRPVIVVASEYGTRVVRFAERGGLDPYFGTGGKVLIKQAEIGGAHPDGFVVDDQGRIVFLADHSTWFDLQRLSRAGVRDTAFATATAKVQAPAGTRALPIATHATQDRYLVAWALEPTSPAETRLTGFNSTGSRWTEVGPGGTTSAAVDYFSPGELAFYNVEGTDATQSDPIVISRSLIE